ncbi:MAG: 16S rRNA (cytosine(1402)-N(4))-methyltransferase RsmH [Prevotella sp.]|nr:16S rRNA (cytosine(1402)-N(4))-methyltransferase RsmH [Prevotella sp.]
MAFKIDSYHVPVLIGESIEGLDIRPNGIYVDATFGGGGHSREILSRLGKSGHLYGFDQDADAEENIIEDERFTFVRSNFRYLKNWMRFYGVKKIDGLLADLGVSSHHLDEGARGFSFRQNSPLDMRMNFSQGKTARDIVNKYDQDSLSNVLYLYGEIKNSKLLASAIVKAREKKEIITTYDLLEVIDPLLNKERQKKELAKVFQALRIEVNDEMMALKELLEASIELLNSKGRLVVITYHSLEDRIVKNLIKTGNLEGKQVEDFFGRKQTLFSMVNSKVIVPNEDEITRNPRSRSAKLRIAEIK